MTSEQEGLDLESQLWVIVSLAYNRICITIHLNVRGIFSIPKFKMTSSGERDTDFSIKQERQ